MMCRPAAPDPRSLDRTFRHNAAAAFCSSLKTPLLDPLHRGLQPNVGDWAVNYVVAAADHTISRNIDKIKKLRGESLNTTDLQMKREPHSGAKPSMSALPATFKLKT